MAKLNEELAKDIFAWLVGVVGIVYFGMTGLVMVANWVAQWRERGGRR